MENLIMTDFINYCKEDNTKLSKDIKIWLSDYFDIHNRVIPIKQYEIEWIKENLSRTDQKEIFGKIII